MELLKELTEAFGPPGFEDDVRAIVLREVKSLADDVRIDKMGNVIAVKRATAKSKDTKKVMLAGHMDEIGFMVKHIDANGYLRLFPLGGFDPKTLIAKRVVVRSNKGKKLLGVVGTKPIHAMSAKERERMPQLKELFVDLGMSAAQVKKQVDLGAPVALAQSYEEIGQLATCKAMDNRIAVWSLIKSLQQLQKKKHSVDVYAVFTVQEEVGLRGALTSAYGVAPDIGLAVDTTVALDIPDIQEHDYCSTIGKGPAITLADGGTIGNPKLVTGLRDIATKAKIPHQLQILGGGATDAGGIWRAHDGVPATTLSLPTRNIHTVAEAVGIKDLQNTVKLLTAFLCAAHTLNLEYT